MAAAALALAGACTFPDYVLTVPGPAAGSGGTSQAGEGNASGTGNASNGGMGAEATGGTTPTSAGAGEGGQGEEPTPVDIGPCGQRPHPTHCWNLEKDADETDVDCGGPRCAPCAAEESCSRDRDCSWGTCLSGACQRAFSLSYVQNTSENETASFRFRAVLSYTGEEQLLLRDVSVRYFFSRNSALEPILPGGTSIQPGVGDITADTRWRIGRQLRGNGITNDAYLEIAFVGGKVISPGDTLELEASAFSGDNQPSFNQKTHFSFDPETALHESKKLAVYVKGERAWGNGPAIVDPPSCLKLGINLDGAAVTIDGTPWLASPASVLGRYINEQVVFKPEVDKGRQDMMRAGFFFHDDAFTYAVDDGEYALVVYTWAADGGETGTLLVQGEERDTFRAQSWAGGGPWVPLGPYRVSVTDGSLTLAAQGDLRVGGIELRTLDE